jgi:hypothetical protein
MAGIRYEEFVDNFLKFIEPSIDFCRNSAP